VKDERNEGNGKKPKISCTVTLGASSSATRATVSISRGDRTVAHGRSKVRNGRVRVPLHVSLAPGRYRITVRVTDASGATTASSSAIRVVR
jgi:hypothetical protein